MEEEEGEEEQKKKKKKKKKKRNPEVLCDFVIEKRNFAAENVEPFENFICLRA